MDLKRIRRDFLNHLMPVRGLGGMTAICFSSFVICAFPCISCQKPATEQNIHEAVESQAEQTSGEETMDDFKFAETITATKEDIMKALQGEWSSKENGFNYSLKIDGSIMTVWYSDNEASPIEFEIGAGMPIKLIPKTQAFDASKGRGYSSIATIRGVLRPAFQMAVDDDLLQKNPFGFQLVGVVINDTIIREAISRDQMRKFLRFVHDDVVYCKYYEVVYFLFHTGMRIS